MSASPPRYTTANNNMSGAAAGNTINHNNTNASGINTTASHRQTLSILATQMEDTSMLALAQEVDAHMAQMKSSVLTAVASIRGRIISKTTEVMTNERVELQNQIDSLSQVVNKLQDQLDFAKNTNDAHTKRIEKLVEHIQQTKLKYRQEEKLRILFNEWKAKTERAKLLKSRAESLAISSEKTHLRSLFARWQHNMLTMLMHKKEAAHKAHLSREVTRLTNDKTMAEAKWAMERIQLNEKLRAEEARRSLLEQQLKAAFMRGICALNMEAMAVLRSAPTAGAADGDGQSNADGSAPHTHGIPADGVDIQTTDFNAIIDSMLPMNSAAAMRAKQQLLAAAGGGGDGKQSDIYTIGSGAAYDNEALFRKQQELQRRLLEEEGGDGNNKNNADHQRIAAVPHYPPHVKTAVPASGKAYLVAGVNTKDGIAVMNIPQQQQPKTVVAAAVGAGASSSATATAPTTSASPRVGSTTASANKKPAMSFGKAPTVTIPTTSSVTNGRIINNNPPRQQQPQQHQPHHHMRSASSSGNTNRPTTPPPTDTHLIQRHTGVEVRVTVNPNYQQQK